MQLTDLGSSSRAYLNTYQKPGGSSLFGHLFKPSVHISPLLSPFSIFTLFHHSFCTPFLPLIA